MLTGHYDSRVTDVMNFTDDAPGADDDASGVAVLLELARVLAGRPLGVDPRARRGRRRGAGPLRLDPHGPDDAGRRHRRAGHVQQRHRRQPAGPTTAPASRASIRLFAEGVPTSETPGAGQHPPLGRRRERLGVPAARPASSTSVADNDDTGMHVRVDLAPRPLPAGQRPHLVPGARLPGGPVHRAQRELRAPAPGRPRRKRRPVRRPARVLRLRLHRPGGPGQPGHRLVAGPGARARRKGVVIVTTDADQRHRAALAAAAPSPTWPATRSCGARPREPDWTHVVARRRRHRARPSTCRRTTSSSASARSTATATAARSPSRSRRAEPGPSQPRPPPDLDGNPEREGDP